MINWEQPLEAYIQDIEPFIKRQWFDAEIVRKGLNFIEVYLPCVRKALIFNIEGTFISGHYNSHRKAKIRNKVEHDKKK